jgi:phosphate:Na+ symporter
MRLPISTLQRSASLAFGLAVLFGPGAAFAEAPGAAPEAIDWVELAMGAIGGLVLFLYGVHELSHALKAVAGERMKRLIGHATGDRFRGLGAGTAATVLLDSSSLTIILLITFVDAGLASFVQALPVVLGANIGTTFSSQVFAIGIDAYAPVLMLAGFLLRMTVKKHHAKDWGAALFGIGLVLFGLHTIGEAAEPLKDQPVVTDWLKTMATPVYGILAGAAITIAIQSSSAMLGIIITLAGQGIIPLEAGIAMMLGAEIGTCADTLVATIGRSRDALRVGLFHLLFNIVTVLVGAVLVEQIVLFATWTSDDVAQQIANAHVAFNVGGALLFLGFVRVVGRLIERAVPEPVKDAVAA